MELDPETAEAMAVALDAVVGLLLNPQEPDMKLEILELPRRARVIALGLLGEYAATAVLQAAAARNCSYEDALAEVVAVTRAHVGLP